MDLPIDLQNKYLERRKRDLENCLACLKKEDFTELAKVGHQLKGNGVTFGYSELTDIGVHLEIAANKKDMNSLEQALNELSHWINCHPN